MPWTDAHPRKARTALRNLAAHYRNGFDCPAHSAQCSLCAKPTYKFNLLSGSTLCDECCGAHVTLMPEAYLRHVLGFHTDDIGQVPVLRAVDAVNYGTDVEGTTVMTFEDANIVCEGRFHVPLAARMQAMSTRRSVARKKLRTPWNVALDKLPYTCFAPHLVLAHVRHPHDSAYLGLLADASSAQERTTGPIAPRNVKVGQRVMEVFTGGTKAQRKYAIKRRKTGKKYTARVKRLFCRGACGAELPLGSFARWNRKNPEPVCIECSDKKRCEACGAFKPRDEFPMGTRRFSGGHCVACVTAAAAAAAAPPPPPETALCKGCSTPKSKDAYKPRTWRNRSNRKPLCEMCVEARESFAAQQVEADAAADADSEKEN